VAPLGGSGCRVRRRAIPGRLPCWVAKTGFRTKSCHQAPSYASRSVGVVWAWWSAAGTPAGQPEAAWAPRRERRQDRCADNRGEWTSRRLEQTQACSRPAKPRLNRCTPPISMMESAQAGVGDDDRIRRRLRLHRAAARRVLLQGIVDAILVVIAYVITNEPAQVLFVQRDHVVKDLAATTAHPAFRYPVLPRRPNARSFWLQTSRLEKSDDVGVKLRIAVQDGVPIGTDIGERLAQLLNHPFGCGMASDVAGARSSGVRAR